MALHLDIGAGIEIDWLLNYRGGSFDRYPDRCE
jgi:hypothetical protein